MAIGKCGEPGIAPIVLHHGAGSADFQSRLWRHVHRAGRCRICGNLRPNRNRPIPRTAQGPPASAHPSSPAVLAGLGRRVFRVDVRYRPANRRLVQQRCPRGSLAVGRVQFYPVEHRFGPAQSASAPHGFQAVVRCGHGRHGLRQPGHRIGAGVCRVWRLGLCRRLAQPERPSRPVLLVDAPTSHRRPVGPLAMDRPAGNVGLWRPVDGFQLVQLRSDQSRYGACGRICSGQPFDWRRLDSDRSVRSLGAFDVPAHHHLGKTRRQRPLQRHVGPANRMAGVAARGLPWHRAHCVARDPRQLSAGVVRHRSGGPVARGRIRRCRPDCAHPVHWGRLPFPHQVGRCRGPGHRPTHSRHRHQGRLPHRTHRSHIECLAHGRWTGRCRVGGNGLHSASIFGVLRLAWQRTAMETARGISRNRRRLDRGAARGARIHRHRLVHAGLAGGRRRPLELDSEGAHDCRMDGLCLGRCRPEIPCCCRRWGP